MFPFIKISLTIMAVCFLTAGAKAANKDQETAAGSYGDLEYENLRHNYDGYDHGMSGYEYGIHLSHGAHPGYGYGYGHGYGHGHGGYGRGQSYQRVYNHMAYGHRYNGYHDYLLKGYGYGH